MPSFQQCVPPTAHFVFFLLPWSLLVFLLPFLPFIATFQIDDPAMWTALFTLLVQLGVTGSQLALRYVEETADRGLLTLCFNLRYSPGVFEAANELISFWMARWLQKQTSRDPFGTIISLIRSIPVEKTELAAWIGNQGDSVPFACKCACLVLLHHLETSPDYKLVLRINNNF